MRPLIARIIAGIIAAGGTPFAGLLLKCAVEAPFTLVSFSPGWFAYFALIWATIGRRLPGDPFTTWLPCIVVNLFWASAFKADFTFDPMDSPLRYYFHAYVWAAEFGGVVGLIVELGSPWRTTPPDSRIPD